MTGGTDTRGAFGERVGGEPGTGCPRARRRTYGGGVTFASDDDVATFVEQLLADHGPLTHAEIVKRLDRSDLDLDASAAQVLDELEDEGLMPAVVVLADGRRVHLPTLLDGRVLTHRLTAAEVAHDVVAVDPDLAAVVWLLGDGAGELGDGRVVDAADPDLDPDLLLDRGVDADDLPWGEQLLLPPGLLRELGAGEGDVVGVSVTDGRWRVERLAEGGLSADDEALRRGVGAWLSRQEPAELTDLLWFACVEEDAFRAPARPVSELLEAWGLVTHGDYVAREGFDFDRWVIDDDAERIASTHRLRPDQAEAVAVLRRRYLDLAGVLAALVGRGDDDDAPDPPDAADEVDADDAADDGDDAGSRPRGTGVDRDALAEAAAALADPDVAEAVLVETLGVSRSAAALGLLAESMQESAPASAQPALGWLLAKAHERRGDVATAEATLRDVVGGPPFAPALRDLARYASDRGNAAEAAALLRRSGVPARDPELALLDRMASTAARALGRNQPCWCGSGRKYKVCHLGREELPIEDRVPWLVSKAVAFVTDGPWRDEVIDVALERARWSEEPLAVYEALSDPLVLDAVLHEGGAFAEFLQVRGDLLPADEQLTAAQWVLCDRSVFEVQAVRPRAWITLQDLRTGDVVVVRETTASRSVRVGDLLCLRVVPAGETHQIIGGAEPVRLADLDALLELLDERPDPAVLVALLSRRFAPPTLQNTEGEPLVLHSLAVLPADLDAVVARLDEALERTGAEEGVHASWAETAEVRGTSAIRSTVELLDDGVLSVGANSDRRLERVMGLLREADPGLTVLEHEQQDGAELARAAAAGPGGPSDDDDGLADGGPEVAAAIAEMMRGYEESWLDEPVPALKGVTPRQAVADPTRRGDVVRLLRSWPEPTLMSMSKVRIAAALGLDLDEG